MAEIEALKAECFNVLTSEIFLTAENERLKAELVSALACVGGHCALTHRP